MKIYWIPKEYSVVEVLLIRRGDVLISTDYFKMGFLLSVRSCAIRLLNQV